MGQLPGAECQYTWQTGLLHNHLAAVKVELRGASLPMNSLGRILHLYAPG